MMRPMIYPLTRRLLFSLPPERAHAWTLGGLHAALATPGVNRLVARAARPPARPVEAFGLRFPNPIGLAAGFDKDARHVEAMMALGFGFIEVGSVTAQPAKGNPQPRLFRLPADGALINRMGLNNGGVEATTRRLAALRDRPVPIFVNVAKSPDPAIEGDAAIADYVFTIERVRAVADAIVLNISCPNSGDGRTFEDPALLDPLLVAAAEAIGPDGPPMLVKVSPDLDDATLRAVVKLAVERGAAGITATNTTVNRAGLRTGRAQLDGIGRGGLSGAPLHLRAVEVVRVISETLAGAVPVIGVGGVAGPAEARAMLDAGATLVQIYTGFIYGGPTTVRRICEGLTA